MRRSIGESLLPQMLGTRESGPVAIDNEELGRAIKNEPIIEIAKFADFAGERSLERLFKTLSIFIGDLKQKADELSGIIGARDHVALRRLAHSAAGSGSIVATARLVAFSRWVEAQCDTAVAVDWALAEQLQATIRETISAFQKLQTKEAIDRLLNPIARTS